MWRLKSFLRSSASRGAILCARAAFKGHEIDEVTGNCTACGASREWRDENPGLCEPDGRPHQRAPLQFERVAA